MKKKSYGLVISKVHDENAYVLGSGQLPQVVLKEDGQWDNWLPTKELQATDFETYACTVYASLNAIEMMIKRLTNFEENFSDRFNYNVAEINPPGDDPHRILESIRATGVIEESLLPRPRTFTEYKKPRPVGDSLLDKAREFPWEIQHEYIRANNQADKIRLMKNALRFSPLCVSVSAWTERNGVYVDNGQRNNHWTVVYGWNALGFKVFDSYDNTLKTLSFDHNIEVVKRFHLERNNYLKQVSIMSKIILALQALISKIFEEQPTPAPIAPVVAPQPQPQPSMGEKLYKVAKSYLGTDPSPRDVASDSLGCAESMSHIIEEVLPDFPIYTGTWSLWSHLVRDKRFSGTLDFKPGVIIISPTGTSTGESIKNGHVGCFGENGVIMSTDSQDGNLKENYTLSKWVDRYRTLGGYPIYFFELLG